MSIANKIGPIVVYNSITNNLSDEKQDSNVAFSFLDWFNHVKIKNFDVNNSFAFYNQYLSDWSTKTLNSDSVKSIVKQKYTELLQEIVINYANSEEKRCLSNIDFTKKNEVLIAIPFFSRKIKQICQYIIKQRDTIRASSKKVGLNGSNFGLKEQVKNIIFDELVILSSNAVDVIKNSNFIIEIEPIYEAIKDYFNNDDIQFANSFPLSAFPEHFMDQGEFDAFKYNLSANEIDQYHEKHLDTDYFYLKVTDKSNKIYELSTFIKGRGKNADNLSNQLFDSIALSANTNNLITEDFFGGFFKPQYLGILYYNTFSLNYEIDFDAVEENKIYVFPDPTKIQQFLYKDNELPLIWFDDTNAIRTSVVDGDKYGQVLHKIFYPCFYGYQSKQQSLDYSLFGITNSSIDYDFWTGDTNEIFSGKSTYGIIDIEEKEKNIIKTNSNIEYYQEDIYGNFFALYKKTGDIRANSSEANGILNIINDGSNNGQLSTGTFIPDIDSEEYLSATMQTDGNGNFGYYYIFCSDIDSDRFSVLGNTNSFLSNSDNKFLSSDDLDPINYNIYNTRYELNSDELYFKTNTSSKVGKLFELFPFLSVRYGIYANELATKLIRFDIFEDTIIFTCKDFIIIDQLKYDYASEELIDPGVYYYFLQSSNIGSFSVPFYDESEDNVYFSYTEIKEDVLSSSADKNFILDVYKLENNTFKLRKLSKSDINSSFTLSSNEGRSVYDIVSLNKPFICKLLDKIAVVFTANDKTGIKIIMNNEFTIKNNYLNVLSSNYVISNDIYSNSTNNGLSSEPLSSYDLESDAILSINETPLSGNHNASISWNLIEFN